MAEKSAEELEQELKAIWLKAGNTRKRTRAVRIEHILGVSRAELSLRDLLMFFIYLCSAFFALLVAVVQGLFGSGESVGSSAMSKAEKNG